MKIIVKAAHCIRKNFYVPSYVATSVLEAGFSKPSVMKLAMDALYRSQDFVYSYKHEAMLHENVFDAIYPLCSEEDRRVLNACLAHGSTLREFRSEAVLNVEPCIRVGALMSLLKAHPWIPENNLLLVREDGASPLEDDCSTLDDCGIDDEDSLLACMGGSFPVTICDIDPFPKEKFVIPISSCFETVGSLKKKIQQKRGVDPKDICLIHRDASFSRTDDIPLIARGIVKRYWNTWDEFDDISMSILHNINVWE